jgi:hypothetical protein
VTSENDWDEILTRRRNANGCLHVQRLQTVRSEDMFFQKVLRKIGVRA